MTISSSSIKSNIIFNRFKVIKTLGSGCVGKVLLVEDLNSKEQYALKILTSELPIDNHTYERFELEFDLQNKIEHQNVIKSYEIFKEDNLIAFTLEYIDGTELFDLVDNPKLTNRLVENILLQIFDGIKELHLNNIFHRDLKLENIILQKNGVVKVGDLGLVKGLFTDNLTRTGILLGTAQYMAPEYIKECKYTAQSDIYSLGIVAFELLTKSRRMADLSPNEVIDQVIKNNFSLTEDELELLDPKYKKFIFKATAVLEEDRYHNVFDLRKELLLIIANKDTEPKINKAEIKESSKKTKIFKIDNNIKLDSFETPKKTKLRKLLFWK